MAQHNRGRRAQGARLVPRGPRCLALGWKQRRKRYLSPLRILDTRVLPPALRPDQRGTGLSASHAPAALTWGPPACPWGRRHQAATPQAAVRGSGRVSHGTAHSPAFCPQLTATSDHTPHSTPCYFHSTKYGGGDRCRVGLALLVTKELMLLSTQALQEPVLPRSQSSKPGSTRLGDRRGCAPGSGPPAGCPQIPGRTAGALQGGQGGTLGVWGSPFLLWRGAQAGRGRRTGPSCRHQGAPTGIPTAPRRCTFTSSRAKRRVGRFRSLALAATQAASGHPVDA